MRSDQKVQMCNAALRNLWSAAVNGLTGCAASMAGKPLQAARRSVSGAPPWFAVRASYRSR